MIVFIVAVAAYACSTAIRVELPNGTRVSPAAAFAGAIAVLGPSGFAPEPLWLIYLLAGAAGSGVIVLARRTVVPVVLQMCGLGVAMVIGSTLATGTDRIGLTSTTAASVGASCAACAYFLIDLSGTIAGLRRTGTTYGPIRDTLKMSLPLGVVLVSTAGLVALVVPRLQWAAFVVVFFPVVAAQREFARYGETRRTYDETVRALAALTEGAGYVSQGHQERVASLCRAMGEELRVTPQRLRELELVALLHDVGAVSFPDPMDVRTVSTEELARRTSWFLRETEYLAGYASLLESGAQGDADLPLEGRILRIAHRFDEAAGSLEDRLRMVRESAHEKDEVVADALKRVVTSQSLRAPITA